MPSATAGLLSCAKTTYPAICRSFGSVTRLYGRRTGTHTKIRNSNTSGHKPADSGWKTLLLSPMDPIGPNDEGGNILGMRLKKKEKNGAP